MEFKVELPSIPYYSGERYLATAFSDDLTITQKLNKIIHFINEYSKVTIEMLTKWNEVYSWVIGEGLDNAVGDRMNEWLLDGRLHDIINREIFEELNAKVDQAYKLMEEKFNDYDVEIANKFKKYDQELNNLIKEIEKDFSELSVSIRKEIENKFDSDAYYHEISFETHRDVPSNTTYYLIKIPKYDEKGNIIRLKHGIPYDKFDGTRETVRHFSKRKLATVVTNVSPSATMGTVIKDGQVYINNTERENYVEILAFNDQNEMRSFPSNTRAETILAQGYKNAMNTFCNLITDGRINNTAINRLSDTLKETHPRTAIAQDYQGNTYIFLCDGRSLNEYGMKPEDVARILSNRGMKFAQMFDGGGSTQATIYHANINKLSEKSGNRNDNYIRGVEERPRDNFIYVGKDKKKDPLSNILTVYGDILKNVTDKMSGYENLRYTYKNWRELEPYLVNGWKNYGTGGAAKCRAWVMPNNTIYFVGTIKDGDPNKPFMILPPEFRPNFTQEFLTLGNRREEIYKVVVRANGEMQFYYWTEESRKTATDYIKIDGIFMPTNPENASD